MSAMNVLQKFYVELITTLPMDDSSFLAKMYSHRILTLKQKKEIRLLDTQEDKAEFFIDCVIGPRVSMGYNEHLDILLNCMEDHEDPLLKDLAQRIKKDLLSVSSKSTLPSTSYQSGIFSTKPEMFDLTKIVIPKIMNEWEYVAESLRYDLATIEAIKEIEGEDPKRCCRQLFKDWLMTNHGAKAGPKVWSTLIDAIKKIGEISADIIEEIILEVKQLEPSCTQQDGSSSQSTKSRDVRKSMPRDLVQFKASDKVNTRPSLRDLSRYIIPQYSPNWKMLGILLDLRSTTLDIIEYEYGGDYERCCRAMLERWLEMDTQATWGKLIDIVETNML